MGFGSVPAVRRAPAAAATRARAASISGCWLVARRNTSINPSAEESLSNALQFAGRNVSPGMRCANAVEADAPRKKNPAVRTRTAAMEITGRITRSGEVDARAPARMTGGCERAATFVLPWDRGPKPRMVGAKASAARRTRERPRRSGQRGCSRLVRGQRMGRCEVVRHHTDRHGNLLGWRSNPRLAELRGQCGREPPLEGCHGSRVQDQVTTGRIALYRSTSVGRVLLCVRSLVRTRSKQQNAMPCAAVLLRALVMSSAVRESRPGRHDHGQERDRADYRPDFRGDTHIRRFAKHYGQCTPACLTAPSCRTG